MRSKMCQGFVLFIGLWVALRSIKAAEQPAPPARELAEVRAVLAQAPAAKYERPLHVVLWAGPKDHGPNEHDYPLWQKRWKVLLGGKSPDDEPILNTFGSPQPASQEELAGAPLVSVSTAWRMPTEEQWSTADVMVMFCAPEWTAPSLKQLEHYLELGKGLVVVHMAMWQESPELAQLIGAAKQPQTQFRHGPLHLEVTAPNHAICRGMPETIDLIDESYFDFVGDLSDAETLAISREMRPQETTPRREPLFWTLARGPGRVFVCVPGHYMWTFDDPLFRLLLLRGTAWAAGELPYRFDILALRGARLRQENAVSAAEPRAPKADDPDLLLWLDATERSTLTADDQGHVSEWQSKALARPCAVRSAGTQRPLLVQNAWDGKPAVRFDGQDDVLRNTQFNQSAPRWTLFLVTCPRSNKGSGVPDGFHGFFSATRKGQPDFVTGMNVDMGGYATDRFVCLNVESNKGSGASNLLFVGTDFGRPRVLVVSSDQEQTRLFAESVSQAARPANDTPTSLEEIRIGARSYVEGQETGFIDAEIAELALYARALSVDEILAISRYLEEKYAVVNRLTPEPRYSLEEAVTALASYEWDGSRAPLAPIDEIVQRGSVAERKTLEENLARVLGQGVSPAAVDFICRRLAIIGTSTCVPVLESLVKDPQRGAAARQALEQIPAVEAGHALLASLAHAEPSEVSALVQCLGARRDPAAVEPLLERLNSGQSTHLEEVARALAQIGDPRAVGALLNASTVSPHVLLTLAGNLAAAGHLPESLRVYEQLGASEDPGVRAAVLRGLVTVDPDRNVERLLQALRGDNDRLRGQAADLLAQVCSEQVLSAVWAEFTGLPIPSQRVLLGKQWSRTPAMGRALAVRAIQSELPEIRCEGLRVLTVVGDVSSVELLGRVAVDDASLPVRQAAESALCHLASAGTDEALIRGLSDAPTVQHTLLIRVLRERRTRGAEPALLTSTESSDQAIRLEALGALEQLGDATLVPTLISCLLTAQTGEEQEAAERAIWRCALRSTDAVDPAAPLIAAFDKGSIPNRTLLLPVLGRVGGPQAARILYAARSDARPDVRAAAIRGLANWPDATMADELLQLARQSDLPEHRIWALRGYIRVVTIPGSRSADQTFSLLQEAWKVSTRNDERRLIVQRLPAVVCVRSLEMALSHLHDPALQQESVQAAAQLSESLLEADPAVARQAIEKILALDIDPALRARLARHMPNRSE
ncbi:MAG: HEAT repeat domain-containing protein [Pirellulaceae bacterium]